MELKVKDSAKLEILADKQEGSYIRLRKNLKKAGVSEPSYDNAAHHIVPAGKTRDILTKFGIHVDDAINGTFLPTKLNSGTPAIKHQGIHTEAYCDNVLKLLEGANTRQQVESRLKYIAEKLQDGSFPIR